MNKSSLFFILGALLVFVSAGAILIFFSIRALIFDAKYPCAGYFKEMPFPQPDFTQPIQLNLILNGQAKYFFPLNADTNQLCNDSAIDDLVIAYSNKYMMNDYFDKLEMNSRPLSNELIRLYVNVCTKPIEILNSDVMLNSCTDTIDKYYVAVYYTLGYTQEKDFFIKEKTSNPLKCKKTY